MRQQGARAGNNDDVERVEDAELDEWVVRLPPAQRDDREEVGQCAEVFLSGERVGCVELAEHDAPAARVAQDVRDARVPNVARVSNFAEGEHVAPVVMRLRPSDGIVDS